MGTAALRTIIGASTPTGNGTISTSPARTGGTPPGEADDIRLQVIAAIHRLPDGDREKIV
jgi:hypothetical protein